ncbi:MAG: phospholipase A [Nibricoccus sp.]
MIRRIMLVCALAGMLAVSGFAAPLIFNLVPPSTPQAPESETEVDLVALNPLSEASTFEPPGKISGLLSTDTASWPVELRTADASPEGITPTGFAFRTYSFTLPAGAKGRLVLELKGITDSPLRTVLDVSADAGAKTTTGAPTAAKTLTSLVAARPLSGLERTFSGRLDVHEPVYFIYGPDAPTGKFQFSFKYRIMQIGKTPAGGVPRKLQFAFTQRSLWDIGAASSPFYDTSYMPEIMFESFQKADEASRGYTWLGYQVALKHESNGKEGDASRSMNTGYLRLVAALGKVKGWHLLVVPEVQAYVGSLEDNPRIKDYRGYGKLRLAAGKTPAPPCSHRSGREKTSTTRACSSISPSPFAPSCWTSSATSSCSTSTATAKASAPMRKSHRRSAPDFRS